MFVGFEKNWPTGALSSITGFRCCFGEIGVNGQLLYVVKRLLWFVRWELTVFVATFR